MRLPSKTTAPCSCRGGGHLICGLRNRHPDRRRVGQRCARQRRPARRPRSRPERRGRRARRKSSRAARRVQRLLQRSARQPQGRLAAALAAAAEVDRGGAGGVRLPAREEGSALRREAGGGARPRDRHRREPRSTSSSRSSRTRGPGPGSRGDSSSPRWPRSSASPRPRSSRRCARSTATVPQRDHRRGGMQLGQLAEALGVTRAELRAAFRSFATTVPRGGICATTWSSSWPTASGSPRRRSRRHCPSSAIPAGAAAGPGGPPGGPGGFGGPGGGPPAGRAGRRVRRAGRAPGGPGGFGGP